MISQVAITGSLPPEVFGPIRRIEAELRKMTPEYCYEILGVQLRVRRAVQDINIALADRSISFSEPEEISLEVPEGAEEETRTLLFELVEFLQGRKEIVPLQSRVQELVRRVHGRAHGCEQPLLTEYDPRYAEVLCA